MIIIQCFVRSLQREKSDNGQGVIREGEGVIREGEGVIHEGIIRGGVIREGIIRWGVIREGTVCDTQGTWPEAGLSRAQ